MRQKLFHASQGEDRKNTEDTKYLLTYENIRAMGCETYKAQRKRSRKKGLEQTELHIELTRLLLRHFSKVLVVAVDNR